MISFFWVVWTVCCLAVEATVDFPYSLLVVLSYVVSVIALVAVLQRSASR